jgi:serine-type D-Ala-D-Ala carboxypeptidase (penicillin-binding protein 5/6)
LQRMNRAKKRSTIELSDRPAFLKRGTVALSLVGLLVAAGALNMKPATAQSQLASMGESSDLPANPVAPDAGYPAPAPLAGPQVTASSAILVDAATGTVLWEKASRVRRPIASTTKIMTGTLLLETARLDDIVTFSERARKTEYANFNAKPGEKVPMLDLLYAIMLRSSNDGCVAAAEHMAGAPWKFAARMTERARELGAMDTNFVTTNGLYHPDHYSTAYDLALLARHATQIPLFNQIVATKTYTLRRSLNKADTLIKNHNKLLTKYDGADGIKTGYVRQSGKCLVASATRLEQGAPWRLIAIVLNSGDTYGDSARLMDWGRKVFEPVFLAHRGERLVNAVVRNGSVDKLALTAAADLTAIVPRGSAARVRQQVIVAPRLKAPIAQDQTAGTLAAVLDGQTVAQIDLVAEAPVQVIWTAGVAPFTGWSALLAALVLAPRYVRTFAKSARRRRRRLASRR